MVQQELDFTKKPKPQSDSCAPNEFGKFLNQAFEAGRDSVDVNTDPIVLAQPENQKGETPKQMAESFIKFHTTHPAIFDALEFVALDWWCDNQDKCSVEFLVDIVRWKHRKIKGGKDYKIKNACRSFYARLLVCKHPQLRHMFNFTKCKADSYWFYEFLKKETLALDPIAIFSKEKK